MQPTIGGIEFVSVARGIEAADAMVKAAEVELLIAQSICPGKYIVMITGFVEAVKSSISAGKKKAGAAAVDSYIIPSLHPDVVPAITATTGATLGEALGIIETCTVASCIVAADIAAKSGDVRLLEIRPGVGLGGKSFVTLTGDVASVESAVRLGAEHPKSLGILVQKVVIPQPHSDIRRIV